VCLCVHCVNCLSTALRCSVLCSALLCCETLVFIPVCVCVLHACTRCTAFGESHLPLCGASPRYLAPWYHVKLYAQSAPASPLARHAQFRQTLFEVSVRLSSSSAHLYQLAFAQQRYLEAHTFRCLRVSKPASVDQIVALPPQIAMWLLPQYKSDRPNAIYSREAYFSALLPACVSVCV
jgi:hypothetical protein